MEWLVVTNYKAFYKGEGAVNDEPGYHFIISVIHGAKKSSSVPDKFRIKIWDASKNAVYDNQFGERMESATADIAGGNIVIHDGKAKNSALARTETNPLSDNTLLRELTVIATAFPNPFVDHFSFEFNSKETTALKVQLINSLGHVIYNAVRSYREDHTYEIKLDNQSANRCLYITGRTRKHCRWHQACKQLNNSDVRRKLTENISMVVKKR